MKTPVRVISLALVLLYFSSTLLGQSSNWIITERVYVKTSQELSLSRERNITKLSKNAYFTTRTELSNIPSGNTIYVSPFWKNLNSGDQYAIDNSIVLYDVSDLSALISQNNLTRNVISIDSIVGEPIIYIVSLRNMTYIQIDSICSVLTSSSYCDIAEPNHVIFSKQPGDISPNPAHNSFYSDQWGLNNSSHPNFDINAPEAWEISTGENIKVAVTDMGFELNHPDLVDNIYISHDCTDGGDGSVNGEYVLNIDTHGTRCTGVIGAVNNNIGVIGVAPDCELILLRRGYSIITADLDTIHYYNSSWGIAALRYAYQNGADVISNSWSIDDPSSNNHTVYDAVLHEAYTLGRNGKGSIIVFSVGNQARNFINYPSSSPYTIAVGAMMSNGTRANFSNYGSNLDVVAPGVDIRTTHIIPYGSYCYSSGTSFAAPMVAGVAALVLSANPDLSSEEVGNVIRSTAYKLPGYSFTTPTANGLWNDSVGYGLVDAYAAVLAVKANYIQNVTYENGTTIEECYPQIVAGYSVTDEMPYGNVIVAAGSHVDYKAAYCIQLMPGFQVENGASFTASIGDCLVNNQTANHMRKRKRFTPLVENVNENKTDCESIGKSNSSDATKLLRDGQILIFRDGKTFTVTGQRAE